MSEDGVGDEAELCFLQLLNTSYRKPMSPWPESLLIHNVLSSISLLTVVLILLVSHFKQRITSQLLLHTSEAVDIVLTFITPITVIVVLYMRVFAVVVSHAAAMRSHITAVTHQRSVTLTKKSELKAARTLGVLVLVFLICFCPFYSVSFGGSLVLYLFYLNTFLNPVMYALFYPWFRKAVKLIVTLQTLQPGPCEARIL